MGKKSKNDKRPKSFDNDEYVCEAAKLTLWSIDVYLKI